MEGVGMSGGQIYQKEITGVIIKCFYQVYNRLGYGFLEKVYENALKFELECQGFEVKKQHPIQVFYRGQPVGNYFADLIVNDIVILELKACEVLRQEHECQLINYLKATGIEIGLLFNFGPEADFRRNIFTKKTV
jgi:GxxExxY protein